MTMSMSPAQRDVVDLSHLVFSAGKIGSLKTLSSTIVLPGDSIELNTVGSFRLSPLRRGLAIDTNLDIFTFYVPFRHIYGDKWVDLIKEGVGSTPIPSEDVGHNAEPWALSFLAQIQSDSHNTIPSIYYGAYKQIFNNYFKIPWDADIETVLADLSENDCRYGFPCAHLKNIWTAPVPPNLDTSYDMSTTGDKLDIIELQSKYASLHTEQERALFATRYRDIISDMGGDVNYDADNRPKLLMRTSTWASGYDVDGTDQSSMGQFSGRVQQSFQHQVPRYFIPEHGIVMTLALARFPPVAGWECDFLATRPNVTYYEFSGDSSLLANNPALRVTTSDFFYSSKHGAATFNIANGQWFRYQRSHVDAAYTSLDGFPFIQQAPIIEGGNLRQAIYIERDDYDDVFQTLQLYHYNIQCRFNNTVYRAIPTARTSLMTSA